MDFNLFVRYPPTLVKYNSSDPSNLEYIQACANLLAISFGIPQEKD